MNDTKNNQLVPNALFLKIGQIIGNPRSKPPIEPIIPVSRGTFMAMVREGVYPAPVKLTSKLNAWKRQDILDLVERINGEQP